MEYSELKQANPSLGEMMRYTLRYGAEHLTDKKFMSALLY